MCAKMNHSYGVLDTPWKLSYHKDRIHNFLAGKTKEIVPVTVHFMPTLRCSYNCWYCTYGKTKKGHANLEMSLGEAKYCLKELKSIGVNGILFTGGGDPTMHPYLIEIMQECRDLGMLFSINTNGYKLTPELSKKVLTLNPVYVRLSINAGSPEVHKLMSGVDGFVKVLENYEALLRNKAETGSISNISVAYVVGILNYRDIEKLADKIDEIEKRVARETGIRTRSDLTVRPVYNYPQSKNYDDKIIEEIIAFLNKRSSEEVEDFKKYMYEAANTPKHILDTAVEIMENTIKPKLMATGSTVRVFYPARRFEAWGKTEPKSYSCCHGLYFYGAVWSDGRLYQCVEQAGMEGYDIGNLLKTSAKQIMTSVERKQKADWINNEVIKTKCPCVCAYEDTNVYLDSLLTGRQMYEPSSPGEKPPDIASFI